MKAATVSRSAALLLAFVLACAAAQAGGTVSQTTYDRLERVYRLVDEAKYDQALRLLDSIRLPRARPYERAVILQTYGYVYAGKEDYERAIEAFAQCLALDALPRSATKGLLYGLAQLQLATGRYAEAVTNLEKWLALEEEPTPEANALAGWAYGQVGSHDRAILYLRKAIGEAESPNEAWYQQLLWVYFETGRYREAVQLLQDMVRLSPRRKEYWLQLSGTYQALDDDRKALAVMELAYQGGLLSDEPELLNLARYYLYLGVPYKAGQLLAKGLASGAIDSRPDNWRLMSDAWLSARELPLALQALDRGLVSTSGGELHLRKAHIAAELADWQLTLEAAEAALATGDLENRGVAYLLGGIALYHQKRHEQALAMFQEAQAFEGSRPQAEQWAAHLVQDLD